MLIGGHWVDARSGATWDLVDPGRGVEVDRVAFGGAEDARAAVDAAADALHGWSRLPPHRRGAVLEAAAEWIRDRADALARLSAEESGKPLGEAKAEWLSACNHLTWFAAEGARAYGRIVPARVPTRRIEVRPEPIGVVATITAWNFPVYNVVRSWAAALAAGCTVVGRPSELTPRSAFALAQALHESGAPFGVVNVVNGDPAGMAQVFLDDPRVRKIAFTGSPRVGKLLMDGASRTLTRLGLELGGNAPVLVFPDVDVPEVARQAATWKLRNAGQVCVAPQRFLVHADVAEAFTEAVAAEVAALRVGHAFEAGVHVGPLVTDRHRARVADLVARSVAAGAQVALGGAPLEREGFFYAPTVLRAVPEGAPVLTEEVFGPVLPVQAVPRPRPGAAARERHRVRPRRLRDGPRARDRPRRRRRPRVRHGGGERLAAVDPRGALRRGQGLRAGARERRRGARRVPGAQDGLRRRSGMSAPRRPTSSPRQVP